MYAIHCFFFKEKHITLIVYITEFFLKSWGAKCITAPPPRVKSGGGGMAPWPPPCGGPHAPTSHFPLQWGFDAQLAGNERRLVTALQDGSVALFHVNLEPAALMQLARVNLACARIPLRQKCAGPSIL